ncbi:uncharacterized protein DS421_2g44820 [Arachis hypogaea]|nr:uncharacterized protein DS421_2g44820 [Arachis hypogaea]
MQEGAGDGEWRSREWCGDQCKRVHDGGMGGARRSVQESSRWCELHDLHDGVALSGEWGLGCDDLRDGEASRSSRGAGGRVSFSRCRSAGGFSSLLRG